MRSLWVTQPPEKSKTKAAIISYSIVMVASDENFIYEQGLYFQRIEQSKEQFDILPKQHENSQNYFPTSAKIIAIMISAHFR